MITRSTTNRRPTTTQELLASLHNDRRATMESLADEPFRIAGGHVDAAEFWRLFDETVRPDGTVDTSGLQPADGAMHAVDPVSVFVAVCVLVVGAFGAGYLAGKDAADTDDADDEAAAEDDAGSDDDGGESTDRIKGEQSIMTFAPGRRGVVTRVITTKLARRPADVSAKQLLADLRTDRAATLKRLRTSRNWRVTTSPMPTDAVWAFIDLSVSPDGTLNLGANDSPVASSLAPTGPVFLEPTTIMILIAAATLAAGALGFGVGYAVNDNEDPGADDDSETDQGEGTGNDGAGGGGTGDDTGDDGGAGRGVVAAPILRNGSLGAVDLTFKAVAVDG